MSVKESSQSSGVIIPWPIRMYSRPSNRIKMVKAIHAFLMYLARISPDARCTSVQYCMYGGQFGFKGLARMSSVGCGRKNLLIQSSCGMFIAIFYAFNIVGIFHVYLCSVVRILLFVWWHSRILCICIVSF